MSRNISPKASVTVEKSELPVNAVGRDRPGKVLITAYKGRTCAMLFRKERLRAAAFLTEEEEESAEPTSEKEKRKAAGSKLGAVYIGKIQNVASNLNACFVEIADKEICFLPLKDASSPYLLNRPYDGRLAAGDELLVQVVRDAQKTKQASVTAHISVSNQYFVIAGGSTKVCYSARLDAGSKKSIQYLFTEHAVFSGGRLRQDVPSLLSQEEYDRMTASGLRPDSICLPPTGCIVRTKAGETEDRETLFGQFWDAAARYVQLLQTALHRNCFTCLREPAPPMAAAIEQLADEGEYGEIVTDDRNVYKALQNCFKDGESAEKLRLYQDDLLPLSKLYSVDSSMDAALGRRVWLKSGGYLIIEPTEALTVIDVNSGKYEAGKGYAEACRKINLEAAEEIAVQLRLRNLSGIILVDFINMAGAEEKRELLARLRELVKRDKVKTEVIDITPLGLVEITRRKISRPLAEQYKVTTYKN